MRIVFQIIGDVAITRPAIYVATGTGTLSGDEETVRIAHTRRGGARTVSSLAVRHFLAGLITLLGYAGLVDTISRIPTNAISISRARRLIWIVVAYRRTVRIDLAVPYTCL